MLEAIRESKKLEELMHRVLEESQNSLPDDVPIAAAIYEVEKNEFNLLSCVHNTRELNNDPTHHAEIVAIRQACEIRKDWRLENCISISTLEPCIMCAATLIQSRIGGIVFGAYDEQYGACGSIYNFPADPRLNHNCFIVGGVLEEECTTSLKRFFKELRNK